MRRCVPMRMKKDKSRHRFYGFHEFLSFRNKGVHEICVIREICGCFVKTRVLFSEKNLVSRLTPKPGSGYPSGFWD